MKVSGQFHAPATFSSGKLLRGHQSRYGRGGEEKNSEYLPEGYRGLLLHQTARSILRHSNYAQKLSVNYMQSARA
jgi:hypothetical protein